MLEDPPFDMPSSLRLLALEPDSPVAPSAGTTGVGSAWTLEALYRAYFDFTWKSLRRLGLAPHEADDAAQQLFEIAGRRLRDIAPGKERSFLFGIAVRLTANHRKARGRAPLTDTSEAALTEVPDSGESLDEAIDRHKARELLDAVLDRLSTDLRTVFVSYELQEMTMAEIADATELPPGTVASRLRRAREQFHAELARLKAAGGAP